MSSSTRRLGIDWVSPLPPVPSGIADYTADLLPYLEARSDLRLLTLENQPVDPALLRSHVHARLEDATDDDHRLAVYQMGNNPYHLPVWRGASKRPGIVLLHDWILHHFHLGRAFEQHRTADYLDWLRADHGRLGEIAGRPRLRGIHGNAAMFELPMNHSLISRQRGVLVHNAWVEERLREVDPELNLERVPMAMPLPRLAPDHEVSALRRLHGLDGARLVLGSFGFQTRIKRTHRVIEALGAAGLEDVHLLVVGKAERDLDIALEAKKAGATERVHSLGYVPFEEFQTAIAACDLCLCLRYPTAGETSAALLRVLASGRAAAVSDHAQFADLPDDVVLKVPLGDEEVPTLVRTLTRLVREPQELARRGHAAREFIARNHDPGAAADAIVSACERLVRAPRSTREGSPDIDRLPSTLTWSAISGALEVELGDGPWPAGARRELVVRLRNTGSCRWLASTAGAGGVALSWHLMAGNVDLLADARWIGLPRDLAPGETHAFHLDVRRPPGDVELVIEPHVLEVASFSALGGPVWRGALPGAPAR